MKPNLKLAPSQTAYEATQEALGRAEPKPESLAAKTVREGQGMSWLPAQFRALWNAPVIKPPRGSIQKALYGK
jgi:hypothetical protein